MTRVELLEKIAEAIDLELERAPMFGTVTAEINFRNGEPTRIETACRRGIVIEERGIR